MQEKTIDIPTIFYIVDDETSDQTENEKTWIDQGYAVDRFKKITEENLPPTSYDMLHFAENITEEQRYDWFNHFWAWNHFRKKQGPSVLCKPNIKLSSETTHDPYKEAIVQLNEDLLSAYFVESTIARFMRLQSPYITIKIPVDQFIIKYINQYCTTKENKLKYINHTE